MTDPSTRNDSRENETLAPREAADEGKETVDDCVAGETESTPKSEVPPALNVTTPGTTEAIARQAQLEAGTEGGYFDSHPGGRSANVPTQELQVKRSQSQLHTPSSTNRSAIPTSTSNATAPGHIDLPDPQTSLSVATRPPPHTTQSSLSIESSTSTSTIRPESPNARPQRPSFPNQAFSALHSQDHGKYYLPPSARRGGPHPHQISTFASAIASLHSSGVRTANNSPAVTPSSGLFSPAGPPSAPAADGTESTGTYASPFLHFTHTHVPKETHVADVDVDPVSGRKLINHYEIIDELGRGTHGKVKLGRDLESSSAQPTYVAIKIVERFSKRRKLGRLGTTEDKVKKEVAILKKARHPNVVALLEVIDDPSRKKVYIVLEWVERGEINWRVKGPREIAMIEARRFEREKSGNHSERALAEDSAVLTEAQKRLQKQKRNQLRAYRQMKRGVQDAPEFWSVEMMGDNESEESEEDRLSRISSLTAQSDAGRLAVETPGRRPSRTPSPLQASADLDAHYLSLTSEPETTSPTSDPDYSSGRRPSSAFSMSGSMSGLEGTMYGPYDPMYSQTSRVASLNSLTSSRSSTADGLTKYANEVLEAPLDSELEYVPVMTMEQIRVAFRDTLLGLQYLHYQGIVHRDIKPPNLLATIDNRVKISDFGVSYLGRPVREGEAGEDVSEAEAQDLGDEAKELAKTVGTPAFYAPELCTTDPTDDPMPVTKAIDVWALGVTLYCMLFGRTPFVDNEFVVMRQIADEEVYLPRRRLQPVDLKPKSRPNSHSRGFLPLQNGRRHELDLVYEEINDDLHDLMKRLLTKDPRKRITLEEVRHHPWVVADLSNPLQWLEETDPSRQSEGKKIEVSKEELNLAVVPLNLVERMRSGMKKILDRTGITRTRAQSNAGSAEKGSPAGSANSSSSTISQDARRQSMRGDESIYNALHKYREGEHPLSKSLAATPENEKHEQRYFDRMPKPNGIDEMSNELSRTPSRPSPPQRAMTVHSAAGSMRTVTQSDYRKALAESPPPSPGLPGTPMALASPGGNHLSGIFGGPSRLIKSVRERSTQSTRRHRTPSSSRGSVEESDHHAEASIAVSHTSAAGHVHAPETLDRFTPNSSAHNSPASSRPHSVVSDHAQQQHLHPVDVGPLSRKSSTSSLASVGRRMGETFRSGARSRSRRAPESSAEDWKRADEERVRKLVRQGKEEMEREKISPQLSESPRAFDGGICPTSPDDLRPRRDDSRVPSLAESSNPDTPADTPSEGFSPTNQTGQLPPALVSSSSDLGSAVSMSISNPSIPSVISEASSVDPRDLYYTNGEEKREQSSDETLNPSPRSKPVMDELVDEGYTPDQELALDTDRDEEEFDSSSDSDGGLVMSRRKSAARGHGLVVGTETPKERRGTGLSTRSKKSSRSGSNNTMKKVRTRESGDERRSMEISEE